MRKILRKITFLLFSAGIACCFLVGCALSTKIEVTYMNGNSQYTVQKYDLNQQITLPEDPVVEGQKFMGWYTDAACTQPYAVGKITAGLTLYAKFEPSVIYIIINTKGGESIPMQAVEPGGTYELPEAVKEGYTFTGYYYVDKDGNEQEFPTSGVIPFNTDTVIFASYVINTYTVTLYDGFSAEPTVAEVEYNKLYMPNVASRPGYTFVAWHTVEENQTEETVYDATQPVKDNVALYAQYTANNYKITVANNVDSTTQELAVTYDAKYALEAADKTGYTFDGYTFNGEEFAATGTYIYAQNIRISASYSKNSYPVTFKNGATGEVITTKNIEHGNKVSEPTAELTKVGYTYTLSSDLSEEITQATEITVTYTAKTAVVTVVGAQDGYVVPTIVFGEKFTLAEPTRLGYAFEGFTGSDGKTYEAGEEYICDFESLILTARFDSDEKLVTFMANGAQVSQATVLSGYKASRPALDPELEGYTFKGWSTKADELVAYDFDEAVTSDITLYASFEANTYTITINLDGGNGIQTSMSVTYGARYDLSTLGTPTKLGYIFNGYDYPTEGTYNVVGNTAITAQWTEDYKTVVFEVDDVEFTSATVLNGYTVAAPAVTPTKTGYTFAGWQNGNKTWDFSSPVTDHITLTAAFNVNAYTITINNDGGEGETSKSVLYDDVYNLTTPTKEGYTFVKYVTASGEEFAISGKYTIAESIAITAVWKKDLSEGMWFDDTAEKGVYVYLVGYKYTFSGTGLEILSFTSGDGACVTISGGHNAVLEAFAPCEFTVAVTKYDINGNATETYTRTMKIVETVATFTVGEDYRSAWVNRNANNFDNDAKGDAMQVGRENYIPDVKVQKLVDNKLVALSLAEANVDVQVLADGVATSDYTLVDNSFTFAEGLVGKTITVTLTPRYAIYDGQSAAFSFVLNNGVNVYDNATFKAAYADASVTKINVLRNIKMELSADQLLVAPQDINTEAQAEGFSFTIPDGTVAPKNGQGGYAVYERASGNLTVNGNYFTADGSNVPLVDGRLGSWGFGEYGNASADGTAYYIVQNVQFSLFKFGVSDATRMSDDILKMENLYVLGNMGEATNWGAGAGETYTVTADGKENRMLVMSGAAIGIQVRFANVDLDNVTIRNCSLGFNAYSTKPRKTENPVAKALHGLEGALHGTTVYAKDCIFENCWANNAYIWGFSLITLDSSVVGVCSGAAIHVDSLPTENKENVNSKLIFKNGTTVTNWLSGNETWFNVYGLSGMASSMKAAINSDVLNATGNQLTIIKKEDNVEKMNFALLVKGAGDRTTTEWQNNDKDGMPTVEVEGLNYLQIGGYEYVKFDTTSFNLTGENYMEGFLSLLPNA